MKRNTLREQHKLWSIESPVVQYMGVMDGEIEKVGKDSLRGGSIVGGFFAMVKGLIF